MRRRVRIVALAIFLLMQMHVVQAAEPIQESVQHAGQEDQAQVPDQADGCALAAPSADGALHVEGTHLVGSNGEPVQLRGLSTHGLAWFPQYVNEEFFRQLHDEWKVNVVRLAMYTAESGGYCTDGNKEALQVLVKQGVQYATACDMYVIVDWHILSDLNPNVYLDESLDFFRTMSNEFKGNDNVIYEICNEPNGGTTWDAVKSYAEQVIPVIRQNDEDAVILVGTPNWSQYVDEAAADPITDYDNIMYTLHFYAATHKDDLRSRMTDALDKGLPIFVTEYGICDASGNGALDLDQAKQWVETMDQYGVSYVAWNISNKDESSAIIKSSCGKTSGFTVEDLSDSGKWLYEMLSGNSPELADNPNADSGQNNAGADKDTNADGVGQNVDAGAVDQGNSVGQNDPESDAQTDTDGSGVTKITSGDIEASAVMRGNWEENGAPTYQYDLTIKNKGETDCSSWELDVPFAGEIKLSNGWNGNYTVEGSTLHITSVDYNGTIPAGSSIRDVGFIVSGAQIAANSGDTSAQNEDGSAGASAQDEDFTDEGAQDANRQDTDAQGAGEQDAGSDWI